MTCCVLVCFLVWVYLKNIWCSAAKISLESQALQDYNKISLELTDVAHCFIRVCNDRFAPVNRCDESFMTELARVSATLISINMSVAAAQCVRDGGMYERTEPDGGRVVSPPERPAV